MRFPFFSKSKAPDFPVPQAVNVVPAPVSVAISAPAPRRSQSMAASVSTTPPRRSNYEALNSNGDRAPLPINLTIRSDMQNWLSTLQRDQLVLLCRHLADNYPLARFAVRLKKNYSCPITVTSASPNPDWNTLADLWWQRLIPRIDFTNRFHFNTLQGIWCQALDTDADVGIMVTDQAGFPQVQTVDGMLLRSPTDAQMAWGGVQQDEFGRVIGYYVYTQKDMIPEQQMLLLYEPNNMGEYRALPPMSLGSNDLRDAHETRQFEKRRMKTRSSIPMVIKTPSGTVEAGQWDDGDEPDETATAREKMRAKADFEGGMIPVLNEGEDLVAPDLGNDTGPNWMDFNASLEGHFCWSINIPPAFIQDAKLTGPNQRAVNDKTKKEIDARKATITRAVEWIRLRCIAWAIAKGDLPPQVGWEKVSTQGPAELSIDMAQQVNDREAVTMGLMTRREFFGKRSLNSERETKRSMNEDKDIIAECRTLATDEKTKVFDQALFDRLLARYLPARSVSFPISPVPPDNAPP